MHNVKKNNVHTTEQRMRKAIKRNDGDKYNREQKTAQETRSSYFNFVHLVTQSLLEPSTATAT
jgi:hypothetical protein